MKHKKFPLLQAFCVLVCLSGSALGGRSFSFNFPVFKSTRAQSPIKVYDGNRVKGDSILMVYHNDMTVAIVELGPEKLLLNCNIIEIFAVEDIDRAIGPLKGKTSIVPITMEEMLHLMNQCAELDQTHIEEHKPVAPPSQEEMKNFSERLEEIKAIFTNKSEVLSGIVPGTVPINVSHSGTNKSFFVFDRNGHFKELVTANVRRHILGYDDSEVTRARVLSVDEGTKWCGTGDVAKDYHELGADSLTDTCCRNHDLCPVKIRAFSKKYGLTNKALYTKSHCRCDDIFSDCLKAHGTKSGEILGQIYFNFVKVQCLEDSKEGKYFRDSKGF